MLAAGDTNGSVYLWNAATGRLTATFHNPNSHGLYDVAFSPNQSLIAVSDSTSDSAGVVYLWNTATGKLAATLKHGALLQGVTFSPDGRTLAAADVAGSVNVWNVTTGKVITALTDPLGQSLIDVAFSPDGGTIAATGDKGSTPIWNAKWLGS